MTKTILQISFVVFVLLLSCNKENLFEEAEHSYPKPSYALPKTTVKQGILFFQDLESLQYTYEYLSSKEEACNQKDDPYYEKMIAHFGHPTLKESLWADRELGAEGYFSQNEILNTIYSCFIQDEVRQILLNPFYEVGIGDTVYSFIAKNKELKFSLSNTIALETLREYNRQNSFHPSDFQEYLLSGMHSTDRNVWGVSSEHFFANDSTEFIFTPLYSNVECETFEKRLSWQLNLRRYTLDTESQLYVIQSTSLFPADVFTFTLGDGTSYSRSENFGTLSHTYQSQGNFSASATATFTFMNEQHSMSSYLGSIDINPNCSETDDFSVQWKDNESHAMTCNLWVHSDIFGSQQGASTRGWEWKPSIGKWKQNEQKVSTDIEYTFRNMYCTIIEHSNEEKTCINCESKRVAKSSIARNRDSSEDHIRSYHRCRNNSTDIELELEILPCP